MNSCLYKARVMHNRLAPKVHRFHYDVFMFYLDLDEIDTLDKKLKFMSRNRFNLFNFRDKDHLQLPRENPDQSKKIRKHITDYLHTNGVQIGNGRIMVLTNLCTFGYQFNPVSFYFCYDEQNQPACSIVEVCNTFLEMKPYFLGAATKQDNSFKLNTEKYFYVSPFIDMDTNFDFDLQIPGEKLQLKIDDYDKEGKRFFISTLSGERKPLTDSNLLLYFFSFPLITLKVIVLIHWQALKLWLKKIHYHKKGDNMQLQKEVYRPYN
ncbi:DUF1365 domain-containing protein [Mucilaginibacter sp. BJC16-A38]|uniref:DUF1365 domain-containing protein n=1 Tax=Mucilaginibacter phenanthrenivorans TaxID=1234842 RepID=UPI002158992C|nr:DUF1365 domain-containing protein [Mucilaginibacter phenanthrenivorans]MCR8559200.1 DUF1365 domain-containing protein [Mucilaginibacter phenanthrenivorans]